MRYIFEIILGIFTLFLISNIGEACFKNTKRTLNDCINDFIFERKSNISEKNFSICSENIKECFKKDLKNKFYRQEDLIRNLSFEFSGWVDMNILRLNKRYDQAKKCIDSIVCGPKNQIVKSIECCSGNKSHFGFPLKKWNDDSYNKYYEKCMKDLSINETNN